MIRLEDLTLAYDRRPAVHHLSGAFDTGSMTAVVGPNGAGKSTLLKALAGSLRPAEGRLELGGLAARDIAYLPQQSAIDRSFPIGVLDTVLLGDWARSGLFGGVDAAVRARATAAIAAVGLAGFERRLIGTLSAGQFQRVLFARLLLQDAKVVLLDEPFAAIDQSTTADLLAVVRRWHDERRTIVAVLHDFEQVRAHFPQTLYLAREAIGWGPTGSVITPANQLRARAMAEAWLPSAEACHRGAA
ncbi:MAG: metal ABC transporter ATP-binding protein [Alphaproteobacteria bacterium]|nr:metal ABC transporter ATP-binding protein [Alphaproteobacteria bacterium]